MRMLSIGLLLFATLSCGAQELALRPVDEAGYQALVKQQAGKVVLMDLWAAWCEGCRVEMPELVKMAKRYAPQGLKYITVTIDSPAELSYAEKFLKRQGVAFPAYYRKAKSDEAFFQSIDPKWTGTLPALFLYDREGKRVKSLIGGTPLAAIDAAVRDALAAK